MIWLALIFSAVLLIIVGFFFFMVSDELVKKPAAKLLFMLLGTLLVGLAPLGTSVIVVYKLLTTSG